VDARLRAWWNRLRARPLESVFAAAVGLFCSWAVLQSFVFNGRWSLSILGSVVVAVGGMLAPVLVSPWELPQKMGRASAAFWETGAGTRALVRGSVYGCVAIAWGLAAVTLLGRGP
jgi:hypothetical protein